MEFCFNCNVELNNVYKTDCNHDYCYNCIVNKLNSAIITKLICSICNKPIDKKSNIVDKVIKYNIAFTKEILTKFIEDENFQKIFMLRNINEEYTKLFWACICVRF